MLKIKPLKFEFAAYASFPWKPNRYSYGVQFGINRTALDQSKLSNFVECTIITVIIHNLTTKNCDNIEKFKTLETMKEVLYEVRCLKSNEDMILALAGQFKQLSREPEKFR